MSLSLLDMFAVAWPLWSPANSATQNYCTNVLVDFLMVVCIYPKPVSDPLIEYRGIQHFSFDHLPSDVLLCSSLKILRYSFFLELRLLEVGSSVPFCVALQQVPARMSYRAVQWNVFGGSSTCITTKSMLLLFFTFTALLLILKLQPVESGGHWLWVTWSGMVNSAGTNAPTILILIDVKTRVKEKKERSQDARPIFVL